MIKRIIGWLLIASPFVTITWALVAFGEWKIALFVWGISLAIGAVLALGCFLVFETHRS